MKRSADVLTSNHSRTSSLPLISSPLATLHMSICLWTTVKTLPPIWRLCQGTGNAYLVGHITPRSRWSSLILHHSTLVWQLFIVEQRIDKSGACSKEQQCPPFKIHTMIIIMMSMKVNSVAEFMLNWLCGVHVGMDLFRPTIVSFSCVH